MTNPNPTLSVVLTVHNAEKTLAEQVARLLDVLPDLSNHFELLIVDDGSTDQTEEVAHELARDYPQLSVARHAHQLGSDAVAKTALDKTTGEVVILHEPSSDAPGEPRRIGEIRREANRPQVVAPEPLRFLQDPALQPVRVAAGAAAIGANAVVRGMRLVPRRMDAPISVPAGPTGKAGSTDRGSASLPRILARLMAQRPATETVQAPVE